MVEKRNAICPNKCPDCPFAATNITGLAKDSLSKKHEASIEWAEAKLSVNTATQELHCSKFPGESINLSVALVLSQNIIEESLLNLFK